MIWALIINGVVAETTDIDPAGRFHPNFQWVECPEYVKQGWRYDGESFFAPTDNQETQQIPLQITRAQGKAILVKSGLYASVEQYINSIEDDSQKLIANIAFNDTVYWQRDSPFLIGVAAALSLDDEMLDQLFIDADKISL